METFLRAAAGVLAALFLILNIGKNEGGIALAAVVGCCILLAGLCMEFLLPVADLIERLISLGDVQSEIVSVMLKITGIGLITQIAVPICADCGHASLGKSLQILSCGVILYLCIPVFDRFLTLIQTILGKVG